MYDYASNNPVKYTDPDGKSSLIIGISVAKKGIDLFGQHSYIMLLNEKNPSENIMLDASGSFYFDLHSKDVLHESAVYPKSLSTNAYKNYFKGEKEYLYTFEIQLDEKQFKIIRSQIEKEDVTRTWLTCAKKTSRVLINSKMFNGIKQTSKPKNLLNQLFNFFKSNNMDVKIIRHDLEDGSYEQIKIKMRSRQNEG